MMMNIILSRSLHLRSTIITNFPSSSTPGCPIPCLSPPNQASFKPIRIRIDQPSQIKHATAGERRGKRTTSQTKVLVNQPKQATTSLDARPAVDQARKQPTKRGRCRWWCWWWWCAPPPLARAPSRSTRCWAQLVPRRSWPMRCSTWTKRSTRQGMARAPWCRKPYSRSASSSSAPKSGCLRWPSGTANRRCSSPSRPTRTVTHPLGATAASCCCC
jgi:hypothetical protein